jgi:di/tricarboxylate transporter
VILTPIAVAASQQAGADPRGMAIAVAMGCSMAFLTPFGHATNILVMSPGGYTVKDYTRIGLPLTIVLSIVMLIALKLNWQF